MKIADLGSRALRDPLIAICEVYGVDPALAPLCVVTDEVERRRVLLATGVGLIDAVSGPVAGHPSGAWALEATVAPWADVAGLAVSTRTMRDGWSPERYVTEMTLRIPSADLTIEANNGETALQDDRGIFAFAAERLRQQARHTKAPNGNSRICSCGTGPARSATLARGRRTGSMR